MQETTKIKSRSYDTSKPAAFVFVICLFLSIGILLVHSLTVYGTGSYRYYSPYYGTYLTGYRTWEPLYMIDSLESIWFIVIPLFVLGIALAIIIKYFKCEMTVTDKRVFGTASFGKRVDLPLDSISAVGSGFPRGICVSTSSGRISFLAVQNRDEIHKCISDLLIERQNSKSSASKIHQEAPRSNADELKKYKDLFDQDVITQEEFDAKKKQLLGL